MSLNIGKNLINEEININTKLHVLIGGQAGSGKSTLMNGCITEAFMESSENLVYLFDLKLVEFNRYKKITDNVFTTIEEMDAALTLLHDKMMKRYHAMAESGETEYSGGKIYIFIDEIADVINHENKKLAKDIRNKLSSIFRMGRAAKVICIVATQYPTKEVIDMQMKMNCQKICLKMNSDVGYRVMLDRKYDELKGNGDAIYQDIYGNITRFQVNNYSNEYVKEWIDAVASFQS